MICDNTSLELELISTLHRYCARSVEPHEEGTSILSALVNLVDTAREQPKMFNSAVNGRRLTQLEREEQVVLFLKAHCSDRL